MSALVVCSGGLDSVTLAHRMAREERLSGLIAFDYAQRHAVELDYARACAARLDVPIDVVDLTSAARLLTGSALTETQAVKVPEGHYAEDTMRSTIVPNRNAIMLTIAFGAAASKGLRSVAAAMHGGDHFIYPDCRPAFTRAFAEMQRAALDGVWNIALEVPFIELTKAEIVAAGAEIGVPFAETWSCYKGGDIHCGRCGTCVERAEAFYLAGVKDPTHYADPHYWQDACNVTGRA
jgi:7-cyano-7-deazaguanine synthase